LGCGLLRKFLQQSNLASMVGFVLGDAMQHVIKGVVCAVLAGNNLEEP
jgi:hypothetical protein